MTQQFVLSRAIRYGGSIIEVDDYHPGCVDKLDEMFEEREFRALYNRMMGNKLNSTDKEKCLNMMRKRGYIV